MISPGGYRPGGPATGGPAAFRPVLIAVVAGVGVLLLGLLTVPMMVVGGSSIMFAAGANCSGGQDSTGQNGTTTTAVSPQAKNSIPADYLSWFQHVGQQYGVPWPILAGIAKVESDDGQSNLPGVHSGANPFGAAGPMQIGIGGAAGNTWGGAAVHPAGEVVAGVATDENSDGVASVYEPPDAIAGAAKYLLAHGVLDDVAAAIFAYNHLASYVQEVLSWANTYSKGGYSVSPVSVDDAPQCLSGSATPNALVANVIAYAEAQLGKPYQWGGTGPDSFDCSGLVMMAYRSAGVNIPRTSEAQYAWGPKVPANQVQPGDLAFFPGSDGTVAAPGHVGLVIGNGFMIEAYATGFPIRIANYTDRDPVGFTRPWAHSGVILPQQTD